MEPDLADIGTRLNQGLPEALEDAYRSRGPLVRSYLARFVPSTDVDHIDADRRPGTGCRGGCPVRAGLLPGAHRRAKIPKATLDKVLADKALLTKILTYHVVGEQVSPDKLSGPLTTLEKGTLKVDGTAPDVTVGPTATEAHVVCGNIRTANATVYIIDSVMMPAS